MITMFHHSKQQFKVLISLFLNRVKIAVTDLDNTVFSALYSKPVDRPRQKQGFRF